jgi:DNA mismatch endonuclease (patch repair protein)
MAKNHKTTLRKKSATVQKRSLGTSPARSKQMALIKSSGNKSTELKLIQLFRAHRIRGWRRKHCMVGRPDFVFPKEHIAVFVDGCFWHGHPTLCRLPSTNRGYWTAKIERNKKRDRAVNRLLRSSGWRVVRIWERQLTTDPSGLLSRLRGLLEGKFN